MALTCSFTTVDSLVYENAPVNAEANHQADVLKSNTGAAAGRNAISTIWASSGLTVKLAEVSTA
jgi:hypothetical protein